MKKIILMALAFSTTAFADGSKMLLDLTTLPTVAIPYSASCVLKRDVSDPACMVATFSSTLEVTTSFGLLKEMQEVKADSLDYATSGVASSALISVVEKFQTVASEQGHDLSFDMVVDTIISIE